VRLPLIFSFLGSGFTAEHAESAEKKLKITSVCFAVSVVNPWLSFILKTLILQEVFGDFGWPGLLRTYENQIPVKE
jgi:hypothetical protein